jgi:hypothetical protein
MAQARQRPAQRRKSPAVSLILSRQMSVKNLVSYTTTIFEQFLPRFVVPNLQII